LSWQSNFSCAKENPNTRKRILIVSLIFIIIIFGSQWARCLQIFFVNNIYQSSNSGRFQKTVTSLKQCFKSDSFHIKKIGRLRFFQRGVYAANQK
jgi:hypothetical protein